MNISILGIGKLGLCFGLNLEQYGYTITGVDVHEDYVGALNNKSFFSYEPQVNELLAKSTKFRATVAISDVLNDDTTILFVMVATPSLQNGAYDHSQIERLAEELIAFGKRNQTVHLVIGCTVMRLLRHAASETERVQLHRHLQSGVHSARQHHSRPALPRPNFDRRG